MENYRFTLEPYKGQNTRFICPNPDCKNKVKTFTRYIDIETGNYIAPHVGRCNREINCGYHYTPKQYFNDNNINIKNKDYSKSTKAFLFPKQRNNSFVNGLVFKQSLKGYDKNNFIKFLFDRFGAQNATKAIERYFIGTSKYWKGATIFWLIDLNGNICSGKIMLYDSTNCKRIKDKNNWVHSLLKIEKGKQCFFGEHQLKDKSKIIIVVESEKTAIIGSIYFPSYIWLASCGGEGLTAQKCEVLKGRNVILFPDISKPKGSQLSFHEKWSLKAKEFGFRVSDLLERKATEEQRIEGLDIADYLLNFESKDFENLNSIITTKDWKPKQDLYFSEGTQETYRMVQERKIIKLEITREESYKAIQYFIDNNTNVMQIDIF